MATCRTLILPVMIIAVDFDGTISRGKYPAIDGEQPYAGDSLRELHAQGHKIIIWTCRTGDRLLDAINWLLEHQIPFPASTITIRRMWPNMAVKPERRYTRTSISTTRISGDFPDGPPAWR